MKIAGKEIVPVEEVGSFYAIAYTSFLQVERLVDERVRYERKIKREGREWTEDDIVFVASNRLNPADEERLVIVTVIFSAVTLEALINDYAISNFSKSYLDNHLDRLNPRSKWLIFPWLVNGKSMSTDGQTFQRLRELFRLRNELVHFKSSTKRAAHPGEKYRIAKKHAADALRTVRLAVAQLKRLDERVSVLWLRESEKTAADRMSVNR